MKLKIGEIVIEDCGYCDKGYVSLDRVECYGCEGMSGIDEDGDKCDVCDGRGLIENDELELCYECEGSELIWSVLWEKVSVKTEIKKIKKRIMNKIGNK